MSGANKALAVLLVASMGLWGCTQGPANGVGNVERVRALETKNAKLEDDYKAAATARDQLRKKLAALEEQRTRQGEQLQTTVKERDELNQQLTARTNERNAVQGQFEQFRNGLRSLLGQVEANLGSPNPPPVTSTAAPATPGTGE